MKIYHLNERYLSRNSSLKNIAGRKSKKLDILKVVCNALKVTITTTLVFSYIIVGTIVQVVLTIYLPILIGEAIDSVLFPDAGLIFASNSFKNGDCNVTISSIICSILNL